MVNHLRKVRTKESPYEIDFIDESLWYKENKEDEYDSDDEENREDAWG
jgi:hypothetical protein